MSRVSNKKIKQMIRSTLTSVYLPDEDWHVDVEFDHFNYPGVWGIGGCSLSGDQWDVFEPITGLLISLTANQMKGDAC